MGAATRDISHDDPRGWRLGGGVTYGALAAARLGFRLRALIGVDQQAASAVELELLRAAGVELELVPLARGPLMENRQTAEGRVQLVEQASDPLSPDALPTTWRATPAVLLASVAGELGEAWAEALPVNSLVGLAWQGLVRRLVPGRPVEPLPLQPSALLARANLALVSADDLAAGAAAPLTQLLPRPGTQLVVSHGARGALHLLRRADGLRARYLPSLAGVNEGDSTGAGDVFLASWWAATACLAGVVPGIEARALALAVSAAGVSVEGSGLPALPTARQVRRRAAG